MRISDVKNPPSKEGGFALIPYKPAQIEERTTIVPFFSVVIVTGRHNKLEESSWMRIQSMRHKDVPSLTV